MKLWQQRMSLHSGLFEYIRLGGDGCDCGLRGHFPSLLLEMNPYEAGIKIQYTLGVSLQFP